MNKLMIAASLVLALGACAEDAVEPVAAVTSNDDALASITQESISTHVTYLASDELEGRLTGEPGHELAAQYVAEHFAALGLEPGGTEGWYQPVPLQSYLVDTESVSITLHRDSGDSELVYRDDFALSGDKVREETSVTAELVYVGFGIHAPDYGYSDYDGIDVKGKIVVRFSGGPDTIPGEVLAHYASGESKAQALVSRGAVGVLTLVSRRMEKSYPWQRIAKSTGTKPGMAWVSLSGEASQFYPEILASGYLSPDAAREMFAGTPLSFDEARDRSEAATPGSVPLGIEATISRKTKIDQLSSPNVIGLLRGTDPELSNEYVVYTAHLDHLGRGVEVDGDDLYNGMYDNAMGTAMVMEAARALAAAPPRRSVLFIALTGEERGLLGSDYFAHYPTVPTDAIVANVNIDMPLFLFPVSGLVAFGAEHSSLQAVATAAANAEGFELMPDPMPEENMFVRSDQYSFVRKGIPAIYLDVGNESTDPEVDGPAVVTNHLQNDYHQPSDDLSLPVDWDSAVRFTRANARIGWTIGNEDARPSWNEGDFFGDLYAPKGESK